MSIWFAEAFVGAELGKDGRRMGALSEEFGDGRFVVRKWRVVIFTARCMRSRRICISTAEMPSLVLLGSLRLTL